MSSAEFAHNFPGMKLAQKNREMSCLPHCKLGRRVPWSGRCDTPSLFNLCGQRRQTLILLNDFNILFALFVCFICFVFLFFLSWLFQ